MNMLVNAQHAIDRDGAITVRTRKLAGRASKISTTTRAVHQARGPAAHLFEAFFTHERRGKGTGLGLYGKLTASSKRRAARSRSKATGRAAVLFARLPPLDRHGRGRRMSARILLADDDHAVRNSRSASAVPASSRGGDGHEREALTKIQEADRVTLLDLKIGHGRPRGAPAARSAPDTSGDGDPHGPYEAAVGAMNARRVRLRPSRSTPTLPAVVPRGDWRRSARAREPEDGVGARSAIEHHPCEAASPMQEVVRPPLGWCSTERHRQGADRARHPRNACAARDGPFVAINCARSPRPARERAVRPREGRVHRRGRHAPGCFEVADGGTLFLDEIGDMTLDLRRSCCA